SNACGGGDWYASAIDHRGDCRPRLFTSITSPSSADIDTLTTTGCAPSEDSGRTLA
ncbi:hypothetical protein V5799_020249, partial [Amblyomma americanum]